MSLYECVCSLVCSVSSLLSLMDTYFALEQKSCIFFFVLKYFLAAPPSGFHPSKAFARTPYFCRGESSSRPLLHLPIIPWPLSWWLQVRSPWGL